MLPRDSGWQRSHYLMMPPSQTDSEICFGEGERARRKEQWPLNCVPQSHTHHHCSCFVVESKADGDAQLQRDVCLERGKNRNSWGIPLRSAAVSESVNEHQRPKRMDEWMNRKPRDGTWQAAGWTASSWLSSAPKSQAAQWDQCRPLLRNGHLE